MRKDGRAIYNADWCVIELVYARASSSSHNLPNAPFWEDLVLRLRYISLILLARPKRFELLTPKFVVWCSALERVLIGNVNADIVRTRPLIRSSVVSISL